MRAKWKKGTILTMGMLIPIICSGQVVTEEEAKAKTVEEITIRAATEDEYTPLPPRDLIARPLTEPIGLETATSVVGRKEIDQMASYSIIDSLKYVPGAWTESRGRKVKQFFSVRGQRYPYPGYAIDGAWFREFLETNYFFSAANVERIEVVRSSSSLLLSPGGMTGVINIVPREFQEQTTRLDLIYGSENTWRSDLIHGDGGKSFNYAVGGGFYHTDGPSAKNAEENMSNFYGRMSFKPAKEWKIDFNTFVIYGDRELRVAEPPAGGALQRRLDSFDPMRTYVFVNKIRYQPDEDSSTEVINNYAQRDFTGFRFDPAANPQNTSWAEDDYEFGSRIIHARRLSEENTLRIGGMFNYWESQTGKRFYVGRPGELWTLSGVIVDEIDLGRWQFDLGYRLSATYFSRFGGFNVEGSANGLASVQVNDEWEDPLHTINLGGACFIDEDELMSLHGNIAWGMIAATPGMLDDNLERPDVENRYKFDLGYRHVFPGLGECDLTGFYVFQDGAALTTSSFVTVDDVDYALFESGDRKNYGVELDVRSVRLENGLQFFANLTAMQTERTFGEDWETDEEVPEVIVGGGVSWRIGDFEWISFVKSISEYENDRYVPGSVGSVPLGDFVEWNTKLAYYFGEEKQNTVFAGFDNACNSEYSTTAGYPDVGCRFKTGTSLKF